MKLKILTGALALLLTGSALTGFSTQAAPSKAESDDHLAQEISEAVFRMDGATAQVSYDDMGYISHRRTAGFLQL